MLAVTPPCILPFTNKRLFCSCSQPLLRSTFSHSEPLTTEAGSVTHLHQLCSAYHLPGVLWRDQEQRLYQGAPRLFLTFTLAF